MLDHAVTHGQLLTNFLGRLIPHADSSMDDDHDGIIFSQEAMRQQEDLLFPSYNFGSEPQHTHQARQPQFRLDDSQNGAGAVSGCGWVASAAAGSRRSGTVTRLAAGRRELKGKIFSDSIHGTFRMDPLNVKIIDTPQFQRLRDLHQLGVTHMVFPTAVHKRFEHSLGTSFKAFEVADRIYRTQGHHLGMEQDDIRLVSLAGLCHDLGHGPFSHVFEYEFLRRKLLNETPGSEEHVRLQNWHHEAMSTRILEYLVDDNNIEGIEQEDIRRISDLIRGDSHEDRGYLFDIVNNKRCGSAIAATRSRLLESRDCSLGRTRTAPFDMSVDVDKVDYLQRDAQLCGVNIGCDFKRLLTLTKVIRNQIAYKWTEYSNIWDLFHARESMHRKVYTHRKTKAVEFMVVDALLEADQALKFSENIHTAEDFCMLNDSLLNTIESYNLHRRLAARLDVDAETCLTKAQAIIKRLRCRDLYRYGNQFLVPYEYLEDRRWEDMSRQFTAEEVASSYRGSDVALKPADIIVSKTKIDFTQGGRNPLDNVLFFDGSDDDVGHYTDPYQVVGILPRYHQEVLLRVYTPNADERYQQAISDALGEWCRRRFGSNVQMATPARRRDPTGNTLPRETAMRDADPRRAAARWQVGPSSATGTISGRQNISFGVGRSGGSIAAGSRAPNGGIAGSVAGPGRSGPAAAAGSIGGTGAADVGSGGMPMIDGNCGGTPTRSTPCGSAAMPRIDPDVTVGTGGRTKRPRSSISLFQDM